MLDLNNDEALHLSLLPRPEDALAYVDALATGRRPAIAARMSGVRPGEVSSWCQSSSVFAAMCADAEDAGTALIDDAVVKGVVTYQPGWASAAKLVLQRRDEGYADKSKVDRTDTVQVIERIPEAKPDEWEGQA